MRRGLLFIAIILLAILPCSLRAEDEKFYYLLSEPLQTNVKLGPLARNLHYGLETGWQFVKAGIAIYVSGQVWVGLVLFVEESLKLPPVITAQSLIDLEMRAHWQNFLELRKLSKIPSASKLMLLSTSSNTFDRYGIVIEQQNRNSLVFVETNKALPEDISTLENHQWQARWGKPISIMNLDATKIQLKFFIGDRQVDGDLKFSLRDFFSEQAISSETAELWRKDFRLAKAELMSKIGSGRSTLLDRTRAQVREYFRRTILNQLRIEADFIDPEGRVQKIGILAERKAAAKIIGMSPIQRMSRALRTAFHFAPLAEARLPYRERIVEKGTCGNLLSHLKAHFWRRTSSFGRTEP